MVLPAHSFPFDQTGSLQLVEVNLGSVPRDPRAYPYDLLFDDTLVGTINCDIPVNIFIVNNRNLRLLEDDDDEFRYEEGIERAKKFKFRFQPPREGAWNVVIENEESDDAEVDVYLDVK